MTTIRILGPGDSAVLEHVAEGVFDNAVDPRWTAEFLADSAPMPERRKEVRA